jgi:Fe-S-cluster containining protein
MATYNLIEQQNKRCIECSWCCENEVHRITHENALEVYYFKGIDLMFDPLCQAWFAVYPKRCKFLTKVEGCSVYNHPAKPLLCSEYMCPYPYLTMKRMWPIFLKASRAILKYKFKDSIK